MRTAYDRLGAADKAGAIDNETHVLCLNIVEVRELLRRIDKAGALASQKASHAMIIDALTDSLTKSET